MFLSSSNLVKVFKKRQRKKKETCMLTKTHYFSNCYRDIKGTPSTLAQLTRFFSKLSIEKFGFGSNNLP